MVKRVKCISNTSYINLTVGSIYDIIAEDLTLKTVTINDGIGVNVYPMTHFKYHYVTSALKELIGVAEGKDSCGTEWKLVSNDSTKVRITSSNRAVAEIVMPMFTAEFGGVSRLLAVLGTYGFSIEYTASATYVDRDVFMQNYILPNSYKYVENTTSKIVYGTDGITQIILEMEGIVISFV